MHTWIKEVNGTKIYYWSLGDVYYVSDCNGNWICENGNLEAVEDFLLSR